MEDFLSFISLPIEFTIGILVALIIFWLLREKAENKRIQKMQSDQVPLEERINEHDEVTPIKQEKKVSQKESEYQKLKRVGLGSSKTFMNINWSNTKSHIILTESMINQLKSFHTANFFIRTILTKIIPEKVLNELSEKALRGELEPGMKVKIENGELEVK